MPMTLDGTEGIGFPLGGSQAISGLGFDQTINNLSGTRTLNTTYTNTTGRPIFLSVIVVEGASGAGQLTVGGVIIDQNNATGAASGQFFTAQSIVPNGASYRYSVVAGTQTLSQWIEIS